jgi:hypothetical protein
MQLCGCGAGYTLIVANDLIDRSRPTAWSKILAIRAALAEGYDLVVAMDADSLIMDPSVAVEDLFDWRYHSMLAADHNGPNSGASAIVRCSLRRS